MRATTPRIPTLDGWRGIAILLVLFDHIQFAVLHRYIRPWTQTGGHGVTLFFVLSGFLITSKLIERPIDLPRFYVRRAFRLMPVAWSYLAALLVAGYLLHIPFTHFDAVRACLLFYRNYVEIRTGGFTGHFWSLSVEGQFYLVWPCILLLVGKRRCIWIAASAALCCAIYRWSFWAHYAEGLKYTRTQIHADSLLVGCLMALLLQYPNIRSKAVLYSKAWGLAAAVGVLLCILHFHQLQPLCESIAIAGVLTATMLHPTFHLSKLLSAPVLTWLGAVSYSAYVWQEFFMAFGGGPVGLFLLCVAMPVCILFSYYCVERPATKFGHRITAQREGRMPVAA
jgi:peptidoglycan/LPS O-acetylase OafA/YrhL